MLNKIQTKIDSLAQGKKLILGTGIQLDEMQKVVALCEDLQSNGQIKIVRVNKDPNSQNIATGIVVEKS